MFCIRGCRYWRVCVRVGVGEGTGVCVRVGVGVGTGVCVRVRVGEVVGVNGNVEVFSWMFL